MVGRKWSITPPSELRVVPLCLDDHPNTIRHTKNKRLKQIVFQCIPSSQTSLSKFLLNSWTTTAWIQQLWKCDVDSFLYSKPTMLDNIWSLANKVTNSWSCLGYSWTTQKLFATCGWAYGAVGDVELLRKLPDKWCFWTNTLFTDPGCRYLFHIVLYTLTMKQPT